ncbi:MAG: hypothetical protein ACLFQG_03920 [Desulfovermiculus sp.]
MFECSALPLAGLLSVISSLLSARSRQFDQERNSVSFMINPANFFFLPALKQKKYFRFAGGKAEHSNIAN